MGADVIVAEAAAVQTLEDLALLLRQLRRRQGRRHGRRPLSYRDLAAMTGWSHGIIGEYLAGNILPPVDRFDLLVALLDAATVERGALATARDRVEDARWHRSVTGAPDSDVPGSFDVPDSDVPGSFEVLGSDIAGSFEVPNSDVPGSFKVAGSDVPGSEGLGDGRRVKPGRVVSACTNPDRPPRDEVAQPPVAMTPGPARQRAERLRAERRGYLRREWQPCQAALRPPTTDRLDIGSEAAQPVELP